MKRLLLTAVHLLAVTALNAQVIYVNSAAIGLNNGSSWTDAYSTLQDGLMRADTSSIDTLWVAQGTYFADEGAGNVNDDRNAHFVMLGGVAIYGGFNGTESSLSQRDWTLNPTILSGDIQQDGDTTNNAKRIIFNDNNGLDSTAILDGFIVTLAYNDNFPISNGAGSLNENSSPTYKNCAFVYNTIHIEGQVSISGTFSTEGKGAGSYNDGGDPTFINCNFDYNSIYSIIEVTGSFSFAGALAQGAGFYNNDGAPRMEGCSFNFNFGYGSAQADFGVFEAVAGIGISTNFGHLTVVNSIFAHNTGDNESSADMIGGGLYCTQDTTVAINCSFIRNTMDQGGAVATYDANVLFLNSILWGNTALVSSTTKEVHTESGTPADMQYCYTDDFDYNSNPGVIHNPAVVPFLDSSSASLNLTPFVCSPVVNVGLDAHVPSGITVDYDNNNRFMGTVDMGAYESQLNYIPPTVNDSSFCEATPINITGQGNMLQWYDDGLLTNMVGMGDTLQPGALTAGTYTYYVTDSAALCPATVSDTVTIIVHALPSVDLGMDTLICDHSTLLLDAGTFAGYNWHDSSTNPAWLLDGNVTGAGTFNYYVTVTDGNGCTDIDSIAVTVSICTAINENENAITISSYPNPTSDLLTVFAEGIDEIAVLQFFNQFGQIIYTNSVVPGERLEINTSEWASGLYHGMVNGVSFKMIKK